MSFQSLLGIDCVLKHKASFPATVLIKTQGGRHPWVAPLNNIMQIRVWGRSNLQSVLKSLLPNKHELKIRNFPNSSDFSEGLVIAMVHLFAWLACLRKSSSFPRRGLKKKAHIVGDARPDCIHSFTQRHVSAHGPWDLTFLEGAWGGASDASAALHPAEQGPLPGSSAMGSEAGPRMHANTWAHSAGSQFRHHPNARAPKRPLSDTGNSQTWLHRRIPGLNRSTFNPRVLLKSF